jgi:hypothetical protein
MFKKVLIDGWSHFGSGDFRVRFDARGCVEVPGTRCEEKDSFVVKVYADFIGAEKPVSAWRDAMRNRWVEVNN